MDAGHTVKIIGDAGAIATGSSLTVSWVAEHALEISLLIAAVTCAATVAAYMATIWIRWRVAEAKIRMYESNGRGD